MQGAPTSKRQWVIRWMYATVIGHLAVGMALPWMMDAALFEPYHRSIEAAFWGALAPPAARAQQVWWISLFGPTVQSVAIWMGALVRIGEVQRSTFAWAALVFGIVVWAPQDMLVSLRAHCWAHVWVDSFALLALLPPLVWLWLHDREASTA